jgi:hypothetical protein
MYYLNERQGQANPRTGEETGGAVQAGRENPSGERVFLKKKYGQLYGSESPL